MLASTSTHLTIQGKSKPSEIQTQTSTVDQTISVTLVTRKVHLTHSHGCQCGKVNIRTFDVEAGSEVVHNVHHAWTDAPGGQSEAVLWLSLSIMGRRQIVLLLPRAR